MCAHIYGKIDLGNSIILLHLIHEATSEREINQVRISFYAAIYIVFV